MKPIRVANAPCSWGALEFDLEGSSAGADRVLSEMSRAGFAGTEFGDWGFMPTETAGLKAILNKYSLEMVGAFVPVALWKKEALAAGIEAAVKTASLLATVASKPVIVLADENGSVPARTNMAGSITPEMGLSPSQWRTFGEGANELARVVLEKTGVTTVFHHHCGGYVETPEEVATLLTVTDPALVGLCLDMGHYRFGGGNPLEAMTVHADRIRHIHYKDCSVEVVERVRREGLNYFQAVAAGVFCELGLGDVDFAAITEILRSRNYDGWIVVEQDVLPGMGSPYESAARNRQFLKTLGL
jgi:inosose dehydratase